jgi:hypothetical protein
MGLGLIQILNSHTDKDLSRSTVKTEIPENHKNTRNKLQVI